jgi:hypothetical protein
MCADMIYKPQLVLLERNVTGGYAEKYLEGRISCKLHT